MLQCTVNELNWIENFKQTNKRKLNGVESVLLRSVFETMYHIEMF